MARDDGNDFVGDSQAGELDDLRAELRGLGLRDIGGADDFVGHQQVHHSHAGGLGLPAGVGDLFGVHGAEVHQQVQQIIVFFSHGALALH